MTTTALYPGVTLHALNENRFKSEYLSVDFLLSGDLLDRAHAAVLTQVMLCGSRDYPTEAALERALYELYDADFYQGGYLLGETMVKHFTMVSARDRFLPDGATVRRDARGLLYSCMLRPLADNGRFRKKHVDNQKKNRIDLLKAEKINRPRYAAHKCMEMLCAGEPCALSTEQMKKSIRGVTPESLYAYYERILREAPVEIFYAGDEDADSLAKDLSAGLRSLFTPKRALCPDVVSTQKREVMRRTEKLPAYQSTLCLGYKTPILMGQKDFTALSLTREMLCLSPLSLIFTNVREKQSLCYYCADRLLSRKGVYMLYSGIDGKNAEKTEKEIDAQISALASGDFSDGLLFDCKRMMKNSLSSMRDNPQALEGWYIRRLLADDPGTPENERAAIDALTREDVMRAAASLQKDSVFLLLASGSAAK